MSIGLGLAGRDGVGLGLGRGGAAVAAAWWQVAGAPAPIVVYQPKGAASLSASYVNLANPGTYDAAPGVAPTFNTATGWTFDGSTQWLTSGISVTSAYTVIARFASATGAGYHDLCGGYTNSYLCTLRPRHENSTHLYGNGTYSTYGGLLTAGVMAVAGNTCYLDGVAETTVNQTGNPAVLFIGERSNGGTPAGTKYKGNVLAVAVYSTALTAPQVATVSAAMAA